MLRVVVTIGVLQLATMLLQVVRTKVLAVALGAEWLGVMGVIDKLLAVIAQTASLSFPFAAIRYLPELWTTDRAAFGRVFGGMRNILALAVGVATAVSLATTVFEPALWGRELLPYRSAVIAATLTLPVVAFVPFLQNALAGMLRERQAMLVALSNAALLTVAAVAGSTWGGLGGFYFTYAALGVAFIVVVISVMSRAIPAKTVPDSPRAAPFALPAPIWRFSTVILVLAFLTPYAALFVHYRVLGEEGARVAGWMQAAIGVSLIVRVGLGSAHALFLIPNVSAGGSAAERLAWSYRFQAVVCLMAGVTVPLLALFPDLVVRVLYSAELVPGARYAGLFVLAEVVALIVGTCQPVILALDHLRVHVAQNVLMQLVLVAVAALTIGRWGVAGAGAASLAAQLALYVTTVVFLRVRYGQGIPRRAGALSAFVVASIAVAAAVGTWIPTVSLTSAGIKLLVYVLLVAALTPFVSPEERARLTALVTRVRARLQLADP